MSRPIVVIVCMVSSSESWEPQQRPHPWHSRAGGGAVHSIMNGLMHCSKSDLLVRRHSCDPLNLAFRLPHVLAVATDICAHRQRTFALHCFRFWFLLASGSPEPHTFFSSATTPPPHSSKRLVLITSSIRPI